MPTRERTILLVASLALGLFLLTAFLGYQRQARQTVAQGELVTVWQAARPIAAYTPLDSNALRPLAIPRRYLQPGLIPTDQPLADWVSVVDIPTDSLLTRAHLVQPGSVQLGLVRVTLTRGLNLESGLVPGDLVMVVASFREGNQDQTRIILPEVRLAAVSTREREPSVSLLVPVERLEELVRLHDFGRALHLTRRPPKAG